MFDGAALGEYYLNGAFVSELVWKSLSTADYVSPIFTTFYILSDVGNILLFNQSDALLLTRFTRATKKLLSWQTTAGSFDLTDYRATWYGLLAAYRILNDTAYLDAAEAGAQWFIKNAVSTGRWLGVCDDTYLERDFNMAHAVGALLQLYGLTGTTAYLDAAIRTAQFYTLHIFNHPQVDASVKKSAGAAIQDWQMSQVGLNFENAGYGGSVDYHGPITISSHAGLFVRIYEHTQDELFLELARTAARGRDAYVQGNTGGSSYPWHGWWHIGWLKDYFISLAHMLSDGKIRFPQGFMTSKVGSHVPYGFKSCTIYGNAVDLWQPRGLVNIGGSANVDWFTARSTDGRKLFVVLLNELASAATVTMTLDPRALMASEVATWGTATALAGSVTRSGSNTWLVSVASEGLSVVEIPTMFAADPLGPAFRSYTVNGTSTAPTVSWSYWIAVESWVEWAVPGSGVWTSMLSSTNYTFSTTLDLGDVTASQVKVRIATKSGSNAGVSAATYWTVN
ncbi:atp synthase f0 sector subunit c [Ophiostoma piceae UAMH 11346]|uniref:Atp synthase f0 sector subunit c n=1 Tax=Ophiostoma piceae (strain UAMH 11346) TaxID=1262450 RepID=S3BML3_OPHP1|nr:atp synthase f0 sector subunit c [Ophiostoma piceae UAMH 11346]